MTAYDNNNIFTIRRRIMTKTTRKKENNKLFFNRNSWKINVGRAKFDYRYAYLFIIISLPQNSNNNDFRLSSDNQYRGINNILISLNIHDIII